MSANSESLRPTHDLEPSLIEWQWVAKRLQKLDLVSGTTDRHIRVSRWRAELLRRGWGFIDSAAGKRVDGSVESWRQLFLRATGENVQPASGAQTVSVP